MGTRRRKKNKPVPKTPGPASANTGGDSPPTGVPAFLPYLLIAVAAFATFAGTLGAGFVWDDINLIVTNPLMKSAGSLPGFFTTDIFTEGDARADYYRPLFLTTLLMDALTFGEKAWGFHLSNIFLHVLASLAVYRFTLILLEYLRGGIAESRDTVIALTAALLFAVHPMHAEPVAWISGRNELLYTLCALLSAGFFIRALPPHGAPRSVHESRQSSRLFFFSAFFYFAALLSKESAAGLPLLLFILLMLSPSPGSMGRFAAIIPHIFAGALYFSIRAAVLDGTGTPGDATFAERLMTAPWILIQYIWLFIWPFSYRILHDINYLQSAGDWRFWSALIVLSAVGLTLLVYLKRLRASTEGRLLLFSAGLFLVLIAPVLGILVEIQPVPLAERYAYAPSLGLILPGALGLTMLLSFARERGFARAIPIPMAALLLVLAASTWHRNSFWRNENVFYQKMIKDAPNFYQGYYNRGRGLYRARNYQGALANFRRAAQLERRNASVQLNLGVTHYALGDMLSAETALLKAIELRPDYFRPYYNLAVLYTRMGRVDDARRNLETVLKLNPAHQGARDRLNRLANP